MKIAIISGSHRHNSESDRVAAFVAKELYLQGESPNTISLAGNPYPLWDEERWQESPRWDTAWSPTSATLKASGAFVFVVPEWGGMVPPGLKNFFLLCQSGELAHKPALIISLSSGINGAYPIAELRASSYKNTRICYLPEQVIVRTCQKVLLGEQNSNQGEAEIRERLVYSLRLLREYAKALEGVRTSGVVDLVRFPFGM